MPLTRSSIERQLTQAEADLSTRVSDLDVQGVEEKARRRDPRWRQLDAHRRQLRRRLIAVSAIEEREKECAVRKSEAASE